MQPGAAVFFRKAGIELIRDKGGCDTSHSLLFYGNHSVLPACPGLRCAAAEGYFGCPTRAAAKEQ